MSVPFVDDATIQSDERLLRRIHPNQVVPDKNGGFRPSSAAFTDRELSVDFASKLNELNRTEQSCVDGHDGYGLVAFAAGTARENQQVVCRDPLPDNPAHGIVYGDKPTRVKKRLVQGSTWIVEIRPPDP